MTNEEIVLERLNNNRFLGKNPIEFRPTDRVEFWSELDYRNYMDRYNNNLEAMKLATSVIDRVDYIIKVGGKTYHKNGRFQCKSGARRSTCDIWRIYKNYFGEIDIFTIMRALYKLVVNGNLNTYRCPDVRKRVYWRDSWTQKDLDVKAELGVPLSEWKDIGLNEQTT